MYTETCLNGRAGSRCSRTLRAKEEQDGRPGLAGCLAAADRVDASAALDALTDEEYAAFSDLDVRYTEKFGFPFMIAVCDLDRIGILVAIERRIETLRVGAQRSARSTRPAFPLAASRQCGTA